MIRPGMTAALVTVVSGAVLAAPAQGATLTVTPAKPTPGVDVVVRGDGMGARERVRVSLTGVGATRVRSSRGGRFTVRFTIPRDAATRRRTLAARAGRRRVKAPVSIVSTAREPSTLIAVSGGRRLLVSPNRAPAGAAVRLTGRRFGRRARVTARLGGARIGRVRARRSGSFSLRGHVPASAPGSRRLGVSSRRARVLTSFRLQSAAEATPPSIAAAGDIACDPADRDYNGGAGRNGRCQQRAVSDGLLSAGVSAVLPLGDEQYENGALAKFMASYHPTWGRLNPIVRPIPGNREYETPGASGYYAYFGAAAGDPAKGYYSYDLGSWHIVALNSNCEFVACNAGSPQEQWLRADLAAHRTACTLLYWHHPRFAAGGAGQAEDTSALFNAAYAARAELVLVGHAHIYERYTPFSPTGVGEPGRGVRQIIVGTGGEEQSRLAPPVPGVEVRSNTSLGYLRVTLRPTGYDWQFVPVAGGALNDRGSTACH
jgi:acid phosphatase type 7